MPTYDYECDACGHSFEEFQNISADPLKKCPECGKRKLRRLFGTGAAIMFKGSGFYQTDYRSESYKKAASADKKVERVFVVQRFFEQIGIEVVRIEQAQDGLKA